MYQCELKAFKYLFYIIRSSIFEENITSRRIDFEKRVLWIFMYVPLLKSKILKNVNHISSLNEKSTMMIPHQIVKLEKPANFRFCANFIGIFFRLLINEIHAFLFFN